MFSGSLKICRSFRNRTGPTVGSMLSAMHASVEFINSCMGRRCRPREANSFRYKKSKTEFRRLPARLRRRLSAAVQVYSDAISRAFGAFRCATACAGRSTAKQLLRLADHVQFAPLLSAFFVVHGV